MIYIPGSIANLGPAFDCLGLAIDGLGDSFTLRFEKKETRVSISGPEAAAIPTDPARNIAALAAQAYLRDNASAQNFSLHISQQLPVAGGLGSSAAAALGGALAAAEALGVKLEEVNEEKIIAVALAAEAQSAGGSPHLDNIAPAFKGGLCLALGNKHCIPLPQNAEWKIALLSPDFELKTKDARSVLPKALLQSAWTAQVGLSLLVAAAFARNDAALLRQHFADPYAEPLRAPLIPRFYEIKDAAFKAGALAASIAGAGPTVFAICADQSSAERCLQAMAEALQAKPRYALVCGISTKGAQQR